MRQRISEKGYPIDKRIVDFLNDWNNNPDGEEGSFPINHFWMSARDVSEIFILKWYVDNSDFDYLKNEIGWEGDENKILLEVGEDLIEVEIDHKGMIDKFYKDNKKEFDDIEDILKDI